LRFLRLLDNFVDQRLSHGDLLPGALDRHPSTRGRFVIVDGNFGAWHATDLSDSVPVAADYPPDALLRHKHVFALENRLIDDEFLHQVLGDVAAFHRTSYHTDGVQLTFTLSKSDPRVRLLLDELYVFAASPDKYLDHVFRNGHFQDLRTPNFLDTFDFLSW
jgi:hypothetical protein